MRAQGRLLVGSYKAYPYLRNAGEVGMGCPRIGVEDSEQRADELLPLIVAVAPRAVAPCPERLVRKSEGALAAHGQEQPLHGFEASHERFDKCGGARIGL